MHLVASLRLLVLLVVGSCASALSQSPPEAPATLALLVGIAEYAPGGSEEFAALQGPENDVARAKKLLVERFHFDASGIRTLVGKEATHAAIVKTFREHLIAKAGQQTRVVFWFSGHGSRIPDAVKKDASPRDIGQDPFDETLLAYDSRSVSASGSFDFTDDELHSLVAALRSRDVVVVTDCCHSGGVLRGGRSPGTREAGFGTASLDRSLIDPFWPKDVPFLEDDLSRDAPAHVVHLAACSAQEQAGEMKTSAGVFGTLTWYLTKTLNTIDARASWGEVASIVRAEVAGHGTKPGQGVQLVGDTGRAVFGGTARPVADGFLVDRYGAKSLSIAAGSLHGIGENAELKLVNLDGNEVGTAVVRKVSPWSSNADWKGPGELPTGAMRAVPKTPGDERPPLSVYLEEGVEAGVLADCEIARVATGDRGDADYVLRRSGASLELLDRGGQLVRTMPTARAEVQQQLRREHRFRSLWEGIAEPGKYRVTVQVLPATQAESEAKRIPLALLRETKGKAEAFPRTLVGAGELDPDNRPSGALVALQVTNHSDEPLHIAIVSVAENREVNVVFGKDDQNLVGAGQSVRKLVWVGPCKGWPKDRSLVDRYVVVATPSYADFRFFEEAEAVPAKRGGGAEMPPFLRQALGGVRTRGPELQQRAWGIAFRDLQVVSPDVFAKAQDK